MIVFVVLIVIIAIVLFVLFFCDVVVLIEAASMFAGCGASIG